MDAGEVEIHARSLADKIIVLEERQANLVPSLHLALEKNAYRDNLARILLGTWAHIHSISQIIHEATNQGCRFPSQTDVNQRVKEFYGIDLSQNQLGICHPASCLATERDFYNRKIVIIRARLRGNSQNGLTIESLREWEQYLGVNPSRILDTAPSLLLVRPKSVRGLS